MSRPEVKIWVDEIDDEALKKVDFAMRRAHGWVCENACYVGGYGNVPEERLTCELPLGHKDPKAHHGRDAEGIEWVWWTYGNNRRIRLHCQRPVLT